VRTGVALLVAGALEAGALEAGALVVELLGGEVLGVAGLGAVLFAAGGGCASSATSFHRVPFRPVSEVHLRPGVNVIEVTCVP